MCRNDINIISRLYVVREIIDAAKERHEQRLREREWKAIVRSAMERLAQIKSKRLARLKRKAEASYYKANDLCMAYKSMRYRK